MYFLLVSCCCPCCEICAVIIKYLWKFLSTVPVYMSEWVCNKEEDDIGLLLTGSKRKKRQEKLLQCKSYASMETQTDMDELENGGTAFSLSTNDRQNDSDKEILPTGHENKSVKMVTFRDQDVKSPSEKTTASCRLLEETDLKSELNTCRDITDCDPDMHDVYLSCSDDADSFECNSDDELLYIE